MKNQAIQYLALDVHQATVVASVRDQQGAVMMRAIVRTEAGAILGLVRGLGPRVHVVFEEGTQAPWLHDLLEPHAERVVVCNVRGKRELANKSDRLDADELSAGLRAGTLKSVYHGGRSVLTLKELVRNYNNLVEDTTRAMLRIKALFRARAIATRGTSVYRPAERNAWLARLDSPGAQARATSLLTQLDLLLDLRPKAKTAMIAEARRQPGWKILRSIPFLGPVRVAEILAILATPWRFRNQATGLAVCGFGRGHAVERRPGVRRREAPRGLRAVLPRRDPIRMKHIYFRISRFAHFPAPEMLTLSAELFTLPAKLFTSSLKLFALSLKLFALSIKLFALTAELFALSLKLLL